MAEERTHTGRKLYLVPLVFELPEGPEGYAEKLDAYWQEAAEHIRKLEGRFGPVKKVFHESVAGEGEEGLRSIERGSPRAHRLIERKCRFGASLASIEDPILLQEAYDWGACLSVVSSRSVQEKVGAFYHAANQKRQKEMEERIDRRLEDGEAALLIIGQEHALRFPADVEVFYISPPTLDELRRMLRDHVNRRVSESVESRETAPEDGQQ